MNYAFKDQIVLNYKGIYIAIQAISNVVGKLWTAHKQNDHKGFRIKIEMHFILVDIFCHEKD